MRPLHHYLFRTVPGSDSEMGHRVFLNCIHYRWAGSLATVYVWRFYLFRKIGQAWTFWPQSVRYTDSATTTNNRGQSHGKADHQQHRRR